MKRKNIIYLLPILLICLLINFREVKAESYFDPDDYELNDGYNLYTINTAGINENEIFTLLADYELVYIDNINQLHIFDAEIIDLEGRFGRADYSGIDLDLEFKIYTNRNEWIMYRISFEADIIWEQGQAKFINLALFNNEVDTSNIDTENSDCLYIFNDNVVMIYCPSFSVADYCFHCYYHVSVPGEGRIIDSANEDYTNLDYFSLSDATLLAGDLFDPTLIKELKLYDIADVIVAIDIADQLGYNRGYNKALEEFPDVQQAYQNGYNEGYNTALALTGGQDFFTNIFNGLGAFFSIELLPNITFGMIIGIPFLISFVWFVIKNMRGGN